jgi:hypothetical protein
MRGTAVPSHPHRRLRDASHPHRRLRDDRGEGVISAAIVVLIMAAIGAAMWLAFNTMWKGIQDRTEDKVEQIGD